MEWLRDQKKVVDDKLCGMIEGDSFDRFSFKECVSKCVVSLLEPDE